MYLGEVFLFKSQGLWNVEVLSWLCFVFMGDLTKALFICLMVFCLSVEKLIRLG